VEIALHIWGRLGDELCMSVSKGVSKAQ